jgi:L-amino acid N-acyltransferase YncA
VTGLTVRKMEPGDVTAACALLNQIIRIGGTTAIETPLSNAEFAAAFHDGLKTLCCHVVLDAADRVAGFQWLGAYGDVPPDCVEIASFTRRDPVLPGAGRALFPHSCAAARQAGYAQINATIRADNRAGLGYYTRMGFVDHSVAPAVPLQDGRPVDRISKRFDLTQGAG